MTRIASSRPPRGGAHGQRRADGADQGEHRRAQQQRRHQDLDAGHRTAEHVGRHRAQHRHRQPGQRPVRTELADHRPEQGAGVNQHLLQRSIAVVAPEHAIHRQHVGEQRQNPDHAGPVAPSTSASATGAEAEPARRRARRRPAGLRHPSGCGRPPAPRARNWVSTRLTAEGHDAGRLRQRERRQWKMGRADRRTASGAVFGDERAHQAGAGVVQRRQRFVEQPEPGAADEQPSQRCPALLPRGQRAAQVVAGRADAEPRQRRIERCALQGGRGASRPASGCSPAASCGRTTPACGRGTPPTAAARRGRPGDRTAGKAAQQGALAAAVGAAHLDQIAGFDRQVEVLEQRPSADGATELFGDEQTGLSHGERQMATTACSLSFGEGTA